jgi:hypothetical protein
MYGVFIFFADVLVMMVELRSVLDIGIGIVAVDVDVEVVYDEYFVLDFQRRSA